MTFYVRVIRGGDKLLYLITGKTSIMKAKGYCTNLAEAKGAIWLGRVSEKVKYTLGQTN